MLALSLILASFIVGTAIGRVLFVARLGASARFTIDKETDQYGHLAAHDTLIDTFDHKSAMTYGLWSMFVWPITVACFIIQAPTPHERRQQKQLELEEFRKKFSETAKDFGLKMVELDA